MRSWSGKRQYGDFANGAQVIIDQFISSGEAKWERFCGLALFLPHGYEGAGPEHSSARLERFLQLCAESNMQVCVPSTPAQMFHMLRRQMLQPFRKPLVVMTPKSLLRHEMSVSSLEDLTRGSFARVIDETDDLPPAQVRRVVFCSGKVYFDLLKARRKDGIRDVALVRIEQLYPFPSEEYEAILNRYPNAREIVWCQEEPQNQGAWYQIRHRLQEVLGGRRQVLYAGRAPAAAPATGIARSTKPSRRALIDAALHATATEDSARETTRLTGSRHRRADTGSGSGRRPPGARDEKELNMTTEIRVPQLPESVADATLVAWHKQPGDAISRDENLADLETDKVVLEVPAPLNGVVREIRIQSGTTVTSGQLLAVIEKRGCRRRAAAAARSCPRQLRRPALRRSRERPPLRPTGHGDGARTPGKLSPSVRRLVEENKLDPGAIPASGKDGRLTKSDVVDFLGKKPTAVLAAPRQRLAGGPTAAAAPAPASRSPHRRGLRARCTPELLRGPCRAARTHDAFASADCAATGRSAVHAGTAHFFQRSGPDCGAGAARPLQGSLREGARREARLHVVLREGFDRSPEEISGVNASVDGTDMIYHEYYDIGVAVSTDRGLMVPIVRDADVKSFATSRKKSASTRRRRARARSRSKI